LKGTAFFFSCLQLVYNLRSMSRVINPDSAGKERTQLTKSVVLAVRELGKQTDINDTTRDLAAFIALALEGIAATIDVSVAAWEKRDYWVKADRFRMEWMWAGVQGAKMRTAVLAEDWETVAQVSAQVGMRLSKIEVSPNHRLGTPWVGAYRKLKSA
jgi:hypothetical protein